MNNNTSNNSRRVCKYGVSCKFNQSGNCKFSHNVTNNNNSRVPNIPQSVCKFGASCKFNQAGNCRFRHTETNSSVINPSVVSELQQLKQQVSALLEQYKQHIPDTPPQKIINDDDDDDDEHNESIVGNYADNEDH